MCQYEFNLEKWVLTGLQNGFTNQQKPQVSSSTSGVPPSCPPYWMMFSSPQQSRLASRHSSDFWEPNPRQRSRSLNASVMRTKFAIDSEDEGEKAAQKTKTPVTPAVANLSRDHSVPVCQRVQRKAQKAFVPDLLNPPACLSSLPHQRRKNLRQCSLSGLETSKKNDPKTDIQSKNSTPHRNPNNRSYTIDRIPSNNKQKPTQMVRDKTLW